MTSQSRRKRPITAPNTLQATIIEPRPARVQTASHPGRPFVAWGILAIALGLAFCSTAIADDASEPSPAPSRLKWQARRSPVQRASDQSEIGASPSFRARPIAPEEPARAPSTRSSRAKLRDSIMQVQSDKADPFKDPFADEDRAKNADLQLSPPTQPESIEPPQSEPAPLRTNPDPFPEDQIPTPPSGDEVMPGNPSPDDLLAPAGTACELARGDCENLIKKLTSRDITRIPVAVDIVGVEGTDYPCECRLAERAFAGRSWSPTKFTWKATGVCHKPLYFEDVQLERYGHSWNPFVQPFMSAGHFFVSVPLLPYKMGLTPPNECIYTLGYYRPGSCAPYVIEPLQLSLRAALYETAAVTGFGYWFWPPAD